MSPAFSEALLSVKTPLFVGKNISQVDPFLPLMPRKGDLSSIKQYGHIRVIFNGNTISDIETNLLREFCKKNDLKITYISIEKLSTGQKLLKRGLADILLGSTDDDHGVIRMVPINTLIKKSVSWTIRSDNTELRDELNHHLNRSLISQSSSDVYREDLAELKKRKTLRVVTRPDHNNFRLKNGKMVGFEYELLQRFAKSQGLWLDVIIVKDEVEMSRLLRDGEADLATINSTDRAFSEMVSSFPYYPARNFIVTRKAEDTYKKLEDVNGQLMAVNNSKYQQQGIEFLMDKGFSISTIEPETEIPTSEFLQRIVDQEYDVAMVSARRYIHAGKFHDDLKVVATVNDQSLHRWSVHQQNIELNIAAITFLRKEFQGEFFNISYKRNFPEKQKKLDKDFYISPYDKLVTKYAEEYQFDWRLILAQMYQESQFKPNVRSDSGAKGLMQIMPRTAKELGLTKVEDPETGIKAGLKYMNILRNRYDNELPVTERNWFALASYNAGFERIEDARNFARELELDPDRWFGNVEVAMQKLAKPENRKHTRFGYCRCGQTVAYVRNIRKLYNSYIQFTDPLILASTGQRLLTDNLSGLPRSPF